jgi:hypothetical protein
VHALSCRKNQPLDIWDFQMFSWEAVEPKITKLKIRYSKIVKSELRRSDRRVASRQMCCVVNIFFKLKKVQMQAVTGQVGVAKPGGKLMTTFFVTLPAAETGWPHLLNYKLISLRTGSSLMNGATIYHAVKNANL